MTGSSDNNILASAIEARTKEISSVRFIRSIDNLTKEEKSAAKELQTKAEFVWHQRVNLRAKMVRRFIDEHPRKSDIYAWAMCPGCDVFVDLLERESAHGASDRPRLPGVSVEDVEERIRLVTAALADRLQRIAAQK